MNVWKVLGAVLSNNDNTTAEQITIIIQKILPLSPLKNRFWWEVTDCHRAKSVDIHTHILKRAFSMHENTKLGP